MVDDEIMTFPGVLELLILSFWPPDAEEDRKFLRACDGGRLEEVESRLKRPQDPNITYEDGHGCLHGASANGHVEVVQVLLEARANCDQARHF